MYTYIYGLYISRLFFSTKKTKHFLGGFSSIYIWLFSKGEPYCSEPEKRKTIIFPFFLSITNMRNKHTLTQNAALCNGDIKFVQKQIQIHKFQVSECAVHFTSTIRRFTSTLHRLSCSANSRPAEQKWRLL